MPLDAFMNTFAGNPLNRASERRSGIAVCIVLRSQESGVRSQNSIENNDFVGIPEIDTLLTTDF